MLSYPETPSLNLRVVREMLPRQRFGPDELLRLPKEEQLRNELPPCAGMTGWGEISLWENTLLRPCLPRRRGLTGKISLHYDADIQRGLLSTPEALLGGEPGNHRLGSGRR